ncbi:hypothetical protein K1W69_05025 [Hoeflea sp. WL0058]|uniref:Uncharacterized protein n=1 Tax=Flavimaribacter sediminis TaxID=2865987 RepID=A0AAE3D0A8_9HYPH|nr:hypothetical protein [Flavimaribacter sediminis]MBW8636546.1 hypothetical protein [Flavimaribacter sediminis]
MKRTVVLAICAATIAMPAHALSRYDSTRLSCARIQEILKSEGAAVLRYPSPRIPALTLYDTYAFHSGYCGYDQYAKPSYVPSQDRKRCPVRVCTDNSRTGDF